MTANQIICVILSLWGFLLIMVIIIVYNLWLYVKNLYEIIKIIDRIQDVIQEEVFPDDADRQ